MVLARWYEHVNILHGGLRNSRGSRLRCKVAVRWLARTKHKCWQCSCTLVDSWPWRRWALVVPYRRMPSSQTFWGAPIPGIRGILLTRWRPPMSPLTWNILVWVVAHTYDAHTNCARECSSFSRNTVRTRRSTNLCRTVYHWNATLQQSSWGLRESMCKTRLTRLRDSESNEFDWSMMSSEKNIMLIPITSKVFLAF